MASDLVAIYRAQYGLTGLNPVFAWRAFRYCRIRRMPVPDWVLQYLDGAADGLWKIEDEQPSEVLPAIARAFKLGGEQGKADAFSRARKELAEKGELDTAIRVAEGVDAGNKLYLVYEDVAKDLGVPVSTVRKRYKKYRTDQ